MTDHRTAVLDAIVAVAPDIDRAAAAASDDLWYDLDLDSMDQVTVFTTLSEKVGVDIPEADYSALDSVDALARYLETRSRG